MFISLLNQFEFEYIAFEMLTELRDLKTKKMFLKNDLCKNSKIYSLFLYPIQRKTTMIACYELLHSKCPRIAWQTSRHWNWQKNMCSYSQENLKQISLGYFVGYAIKNSSLFLWCSATPLAILCISPNSEISFCPGLHLRGFILSNLGNRIVLLIEYGLQRKD